ncbi:hypothetical protein KSP35_18030 [Aquihabitans sp. G128]|uniref:SCO6745 family protein n=1 Tax=Aquihabitans sp. G128 TaxID=2849779 RepID=UPI001C21A88A|nr:hypothetical protein [Aquihabitans sp. G128]QXC60227.1 hypothetical protein KSP35_18030 [Aquihabitans sp. G128]
MVDTATARNIAFRLEPVHGFIYFAPEAALAYEELGLDGQDGYFASRSAAMGRVGAEVVIATFFNFKPELVHRALPSAWDKTTPEAVLAARLQGADQALRRMLGDAVDHPDLAESAVLARRAAEAGDPSGRPIFAAHAALPWPEEPHLQLFHAVTLLREHRGDGHVAALTLEGYDAVEALVTHLAAGEIALPASLLQATRGWSDDEWEAGQERLRVKGHLDQAGALSLTDAGRRARDRVEAMTDAAALAPWSALGDDDVARLKAISAPFTKVVAKAMFGR